MADPKEPQIGLTPKNPPKNPCVEYGIKKLYFVDLILPHRFFESLLPRLARADLGLTIFYEVKSNLTYHQIELLASAGVRLLQPGIESLSTPILRLIRKGVTGFQNLRLLKWAAELGVDVVWNLLYNFTGEDKGEYTQMAALVPLTSHCNPRTRAAVGSGSTGSAPSSLTRIGLAINCSADTQPTKPSSAFLRSG